MPFYVTGYLLVILCITDTPESQNRYNPRRIEYLRSDEPLEHA